MRIIAHRALGKANISQAISAIANLSMCLRARIAMYMCFEERLNSRATTIFISVVSE